MAAELPAPTLVLPVDQAEELFNVDAGPEAARFLELLGGLLGQGADLTPAIMVAVTIRADRYEPLQVAPQLAGVHSVMFDELKPMPPAGYTEVITGPARRATAAGRRLLVEPALVDRLLADTAEGADALPLLALTLQRLYRKWGYDGDLTVAEYEQLGGMAQVVQHQVDDLLAADPEQRQGQLDVLHDAFIPWLATINPDNDQPMRRLARWDDLPVASHPLIQALVEKRLLVKDTRDGEVVVEVALESLLRQWRELAGWLREEAQDLKDADSLERAAADWHANDRNDSWLLEGTRLREAENLAATPRFRNRLDPTRDFLHASRTREDDRVEAEKQRQQAELQAAKQYAAALRKRSRILIAMLAVVVVIAVVAAGLTLLYFHANNEANKRLYEATAEKLIAGARNSLNKGVDKLALQQLLAGQQLLARQGLTSTTDVAQFYPMAARSADTRKIMENPVNQSDKHVVPVRSVAVSADGRYIASVSDDHRARVWDADSGSRLHDWDVGDKGAVWSVAFMPDSPVGTRIATGNESGTLQLWDVNGGKTSSPMEHGGPVNSIAFSRDGRLIATGSGDGVVRVWDAATGTERQHIAAGKTSVRSVAFGPADLVASGGDDYTVRLCNAHDGREVAKLEIDTPVMSVAFSPTGDRVAVGGLDGSIRTLDGRILEPQGTRFPAHPNPVNSVAFSTDGKSIVSGGQDNTVKVWDASTHMQVGNALAGHRGAVQSVTYNQDGTRIVSGSIDGTVREWDVVAGLPIPTGQGEEIRAVAFSPDGHRMASAGTDGTIKLWDVNTAALVDVLGQPSAGNDHAINTLAFNPQNSSQIVTGSTDGEVRVWNTGNPQASKNLQKVEPLGPPLGGRLRIQSVAFSEDGTRIVSGGFDSAIRLWDARTLTPVNAVSAQRTNEQGDLVPYQVWSVAFRPDGRQVASGSGFDLAIAGQNNNLIQLWNVDPALSPSGDPIKDQSVEGQPGSNIYSLGFSPDGDRIVSGKNDGTVTLWDVASRKSAVPPMSADQNAVFSVAYAYRHRWIAAGGGGGTVTVWDTVNNPPVPMPLEGRQKWVQSVAFSRDDKWILSGSGDGSLHLWPAPQVLSEVVCSKLTTNMSRRQWSELVPPQIDYIKLCPDLQESPD